MLEFRQDARRHEWFPVSLDMLYRFAAYRRATTCGIDRHHT